MFFIILAQCALARRRRYYPSPQRAAKPRCCHQLQPFWRSRLACQTQVVVLSQHSLSLHCYADAIARTAIVSKRTDRWTDGQTDRVGSYADMIPRDGRFHPFIYIMTSGIALSIVMANDQTNESVSEFGKRKGNLSTAIVRIV